MSSYHSGEPEPTVPFDRRPEPQDGNGYPAPYDDESPTRQAYPSRDYQDYPTQDYSAQDYASRDYPSRDYPGEDYRSQDYAAGRYPAQGYPARYPVAPAPGYGALEPAPYYGYPADPRQQAYQNGLYSAQKSRVAAGLLALFLGGLGIHNFYLGRTGIGLLQLLLTVLTLGVLAPGVGIWALVEAILIFSRSPSFATDRRGIPLRD